MYVCAWHRICLVHGMYAALDSWHVLCGTPAATRWALGISCVLITPQCWMPGCGQGIERAAAAAAAAAASLC
jgi:hypothetical protein